MQNLSNFSYIKTNKNGVDLHFKVIPNASKSEIIEVFEEHIKIKLKAPPIDGKANKELVLFLSDFFKIPKSKIDILKGEKNKLKTVHIEGKEEYFKEKLQPYINY